MSVIDRILLIAEYNNLSMTEFSKRIGVSKSYIGKMKLTQSDNIGLNVVINIKNNFPEISLEWLILGAGKMQSKLSSDDVKIIKKQMDKTLHILEDIQDNYVKSGTKTGQNKPKTTKNLKTT